MATTPSTFLIQNYTRPGPARLHEFPITLFHFLSLGLADLAQEDYFIYWLCSYGLFPADGFEWPRFALAVALLSSLPPCLHCPSCTGHNQILIP